MRTYVVLAATPLDGTFKFVANIEASGADQAIRIAATEHGDARYVAVPDRSWNEQSAKRKVIIVLGDEEAEAHEPEPEPEPEDDEDEDDEDEPPAASQQTLR